MENIINSIKNLFTTYGFRCASIVVATILIVNLIKKPIVKKANELMQSTGVDKSVVTKNITFLPVVVAFVLETLVTLVCEKFDFRALNFGTITSCAITYGALAIATYESIKKHLEAYASNKNSTLNSGVTVAEKLSEKVNKETKLTQNEGGVNCEQSSKTTDSVPVHFDING